MLDITENDTPPTEGVAHFHRRPGSLMTGMAALFHRNIQSTFF